MLAEKQFFQYLRGSVTFCMDFAVPSYFLDKLVKCKSVFLPLDGATLSVQVLLFMGFNNIC